MMLYRVVAALVFANAAAAGMSALADDAEQKSAALSPAGQADPELAQKGKSLYVEYCFHCHGLNMVSPGTVAYDLRQFPHNDKARFVNSVTHGKDNRMPAWGDVLSAAEIDEIWAYVLTGGKL
jgi:mono/diheme cytochrome c family protein